MSSYRSGEYRSRRQWMSAFAIAFAATIVAASAAAQPFGTFLSLGGNPSTGHVAIPASPALNPAGAFTFEAWVSITNNAISQDCRSIAGKNWQKAWWVGLCGVGGKPMLRSYLKGQTTGRDGGEIEPGRWTHVAVVFDGTKRFHYVNGELAATFDEAGPLTASDDPMRIGSDVNWPYVPGGAIDEVRLWNVARTQGQLRGAMGRELTAPEAGLVAVWPFSGIVADIIGPHDGTMIGSNVGFLTLPAAPNCGDNTATSLCLLDRFAISARWRTDPAGKLTNGQAQVVNAANNGSGLFWFFGADNWEVLVKSLNGCGVNNRYWLFSSATTNVFYRMEVLDVKTGRQKIYFNYPGPPAPAVTDTDAFATCPY